MRQENYLFPGYPILQDDRFFKLSQDSVILSSFARLRKNDKLLDLGCGVGVLTLLMLIRTPGLRATGLEIIEGAAELARENIALNHLEDRGEILCCDLREMPKTMYDGYTAVISNPPYFSQNQGAASDTEILATARNEQQGGIFEVCRAAAKALRWGGRFYVCYPPDRMAALFAALKEARLEPKRMRLVFPDAQHAPCLILLEARKGGGEGLKIEPSLMLYENNEKTPEFIRIYQLEESQHAR